ncbi:hypothetical protein BO70DRAFT_362443 [Aspergillus heteromorphus CBS 117.55]|uniref:Uncharacterized protein n=1 Tax=Aspergillus heteromorphus CBS 117.55 TaxID=1448321 RepID=A0A317W4K2_9EURO|nr:uncharacterized protein BO70DRAFT_362443 [Aspergillus heteromorphus CBS 117.55]PWY80491.1 hypothetical protein BO70DRAFT_362443 [Aspergillus heteromorphus CBS 117.55]
MEEPSDINLTNNPPEHTQTTIPLNNTGQGPLLVPGFAGIPIHYALPSDARFAHGMVEWRQAPAVTAREIAMVAAMDNLTDRANWHVDIFDDEAVADWKREVFGTTPLMSEKTWEWCLKELRDKAVYFREKGHIRVLDTGSCVCKADSEGLRSLGAVFRSSVPALLREQEEQRVLDWQSKTVLNVVDPLLFPLVYGRSLVLTAGGRVDLHDALGSYKDATVAPQHFDRRVHSQALQKKIDECRDPCMGISPHRGDKSEFYRWSSNYQCLPCEVEFIGDSGTEVQITSYINNLYPVHKGLYHAIEKLVSLAIKPWNDCLVQGQRDWQNDFNQGQLGPVPLRIITYGVEWENELPDWALAFRVPSEARKRMYRKAQEALQSSKDDKSNKGRNQHLTAQKRLASLRDVAGKEDMQLPPPDSDLWRKAKEYLQLPEDGSNTPVPVPDDWADGEDTPWRILRQKADRTIRYKHPEPGTAFSYEEWKSNQHNDKAIVDIVRHRNDWGGFGRPFKPLTPAHTPYTITLEDRFRKQGLQIIVKIENIELTPQAPTHSTDTWQLDGQLNEHITAVAIFPYDVANITPPRIAFRQYTTLHGVFYQYAEERYTTREFNMRCLPAHRYGKIAGKEIGAIAEILGFDPLHLSSDYHGSKSYQGIGSVATPQGRLVTFPSTLEHRVEPFQLVDASKPGHYRSIQLYLVDPHYRVCSTRNVPPQQHHWWAQEVARDLATKGLPRELVDEITQRTGSWPMGMEEARRHRAELVKEHRWNEVTKLASMSGPGF